MMVLDLSSIIMHPVGFASLHQTSAQAENTWDKSRAERLLHAA